MLILTRKKGEAVTITAGGQTIKVVVTQIRDGHVRLGFDAPAEVKIVRDNAKRKGAA